ncbi:hypothetical protein HZH68_012009 [Vespula germanica]|uniref:Uncharacterized protein n=1 Tax=Vespula germanica TaxID=30212 RepID=A0A834MYU8_VESGE|nr:hypothetical protein HZH68_012009 [Vespula germanica]
MGGVEGGGDVGSGTGSGIEGVGGSVTGPSLARAYHPQDFNKYPKQLISTGSRVSSRAGRNFLGYVKKVNVGGWSTN